MGLLNKSTNKTLVQEAHDAIVQLIGVNKPIFGKASVDAFLGMESRKDPAAQGTILSTVTDICNALRREPAVVAWIEELSHANSAGIIAGNREAITVGLESLRSSWVNDAFENLALATLGQLNPRKTVQQYSNECPLPEVGQFAHTFGGVPTLAGLGSPDFIPSYAMESFDPTPHLDFLVSAAMISVQSTVPGGFEEVWFPTISLPPGQAGIDIPVQVPKLLTRRFRNKNSGAPLPPQKINLVEAAYNPAILTSNATKIVPIATGNPPQLVSAAKVPTWQEEVLGEKVDTRPILFGQKVGLIELSTFAAIENGGPLDLTDALYSNVSISDVWFTIKITTGIGTTPVVKQAVVKNNIANYAGALLQTKAIGRAQSLQTVATMPLFVTSDFKSLSGDSESIIRTALEGILNVASGTKFTIEGSVRLSAEADTEIADMNVDQSEPLVLKAYTPGTGNTGVINYSKEVLNNATTKVEFIMEGWYPDANRTNSNLRTNGLIIDAGNVVNYRLAIKASPPFTARQPINSPDQVTFEMLSNVTSLWATGQCIDKLLQLESWLEVVSGTPLGVGIMTNQCPIMGGEFVTPTLHRDVVNLPQLVNSWQSKDTLVNIRAQIQLALMHNSLELYMDSGYSAALQMLMSDPNAYETIVLTDPNTAQFMMEAGDIRTMGDSRKYIITTTLNKNIRGKIYYSFRLVGSGDIVHPMSFGCKLASPSITYEVNPMNRNGATISEKHSMPRIVPAVNLPVLGVITVLGLENFVSSAE